MVTISQLKLLSRGVYSNPRRKSKMGCFLKIVENTPSLIFDSFLNMALLRPVSYWSNMMRCAIWYHLYNLKNVKKHQWRSVSLSKVAGWKLNCTNGTKSHNTSHIIVIVYCYLERENYKVLKFLLHWNKYLHLLSVAI